ncbi:hypothetical protein [Pseudonocardia acaciae]|uniref:hypothetical protein n=1 Tax=Pseudonocardia acaciae TaxID=551276 RepID=UPI0012ED986A|nr:hypothetical protein [Pseudonocardia acaciae]
MVCIIDSGDISGLLGRRSFSDKSDTYSVAWRQDQWPVVKSQLALLVTDGRIDWVGRARGRKRVSDRDRRIEITDIEEFLSLSINDLRSWLPEKHDGDVLLSVLSNDLATIVIRELPDRFLDWASKLEWLNRPKEFDLPSGDRGRILNEGRDGLGLVLEMSGVGKDTLREWSPTVAQQPTFLSGIGRRSVSEEQLINYDIGRIPGLFSRESLDIDWRVFSRGRRRVLS